MICCSKLTSIHLYFIKFLNEELLTCNLYMRDCLSLNTTLYAISYPGITQFSLYVSTVLSNISSALSKIFFKVCLVLAIEFNAGPPYYVWVAVPHIGESSSVYRRKGDTRTDVCCKLFKSLFLKNQEASNKCTSVEEEQKGKKESMSKACKLLIQ